MNQKFSYLQSFKIIVLALLVAVGTGYLFADFSAPTQAPPGCPAGKPGCDAPINTSITSQSKLGQLLINTSTSKPFAVGLQVFGKSIFTKGATDSIALDVTGTVKTTGLQVTGGTTGKVLTAMDNDGNLGWGDITVPVNTTPTPSFFVNLSEVIGNNSGKSSVVGLLDPGTYTFSGRMTTTNNGGGGYAAAFFNSSDELTYAEARAYLVEKCGGPKAAVTNGSGPTYDMYSNLDDAGILFCLKRNGSNDDSYNMQPRVITFTSPTFLYLLGSQVSMKGYVHY